MKYKFLICALCFHLIVNNALGQQKQYWKGKIENKNGVKIIINPKEPWFSEDIFELKDELTIGEAEGQKESMFSRISGIAVDNEERIYVLDYKEAHIRVYDVNGDYLKTIGRAGQGPGELALPYSICLTEQDQIMIQDLNNHRMLFFSLDGKYLKSISTAEFIMVGSWVDSQGDIIGLVSTSGPEEQILELKKFNQKLVTLNSFYSFSRARKRSGFNPFMPELCWAVDSNDFIICGYSENYEIQIFNPEGKTIRKIIKDFEKVSITADERERAKKRLPGPMKLDAPKYHPAFQSITVDDVGRIFVQTWEKTKDKSAFFFDIFDSKGRYIAKIPMRFRPRILKKGKFYSVEEDDDGFQFVKRYKMVWNKGLSSH
ncbi:MAG: 6-bladed beta-propeller [Pseudomonadota bacterium]